MFLMILSIRFIKLPVPGASFSCTLLKLSAIGFLMFEHKRRDDLVYIDSIVFRLARICIG